MGAWGVYRDYISVMSDSEARGADTIVGESWYTRASFYLDPKPPFGPFLVALGYCLHTFGVQVNPHVERTPESR